MTIAAIVVGVIILVILAASPRFGCRLYGKMIFGPIKAKPRDYSVKSLAGVAKEDVYFTSGGNRLHGYLFLKPGAHRIVLFSHSNWGNVDKWSPLIGQLVEAGASVFAYDYRGYGQSEGTPTVRAICKDGIAAYDYLVKVRGFRPEQIVLCGSSLGTGVTTEILRKRDCAGIILHAAFSSMRELTIALMPWARWVPNLLFFRPELNNARTLSQFNKPLLIAQGQYDEMVPSEQPRKILSQSASTSRRLVELPAASHMDTSNPLFVDSVREFLQALPAVA